MNQLLIKYKKVLRQAQVITAPSSTLIAFLSLLIITSDTGLNLRKYYQLAESPKFQSEPEP